MNVKKGKVIIMGGGPGGTENLTLKALYYLQRADVVIYDRLIDKGILKECKPAAELIYMGKELGEAIKQEDINSLMRDKAKQGKLVVRLKGGDPFIFGRGGEEALYLAQNDIPFLVVPGLSSAFAVPACAGIPLTMRGLSSSVTIVSGHKANMTELNWEHLATSETLVVLMGRSNMSEIAKELLKRGLNPETGFAIVSQGCTNAQKIIITDLNKVAEGEYNTYKFPSPTMLIIGEVVKMGEQLNWMNRLPLAGVKVVVTTEDEKLSKLLIEEGAEVFSYPVITVLPILNFPSTAFLEELNQFDWIIFTSKNGVKFFLDYLFRSGKDCRAFSNARIAVIGPATYKTLESFGLRADFMPGSYTSESLVNEFPFSFKNLKFIIPGPQKPNLFLYQALVKEGAIVTQLPIYRVEAPLSASSEKEELLAFLSSAPIITFTSSSCVRNFFKLTSSFLSKKVVMKCPIAVIGPVSAESVRNFGFTPQIMADSYTLEGLVEAIKQWKKSG